MLKLSKELIASLNDNSPVETLNLESGSLELYKSHAGDLLLDSQYLNIVLRMDNLTVLGFHIPSIQKVPIRSEPTGTNRIPIMSSVVGFCKDGNHINVQHWDGYLSVFDAQDLALLEQRVTR